MVQQVLSVTYNEDAFPAQHETDIWFRVKMHAKLWTLITRGCFLLLLCVLWCFHIKPNPPCTHNDNHKWISSWVYFIFNLTSEHPLWVGFWSTSNCHYIIVSIQDISIISVFSRGSTCLNHVKSDDAPLTGCNTQMCFRLLASLLDESAAQWMSQFSITSMKSSFSYWHQYL